MVTLFFPETDSFSAFFVLIFVKTTVSMALDDDEDDEVVTRFSCELFVHEDNEDGEELLLSFFFEVKQDPPHSCTLTAKLDLDPEVT